MTIVVLAPEIEEGTVGKSMYRIGAGSNRPVLIETFVTRETELSYFFIAAGAEQSRRKAGPNSLWHKMADTPAGAWRIYLAELAEQVAAAERRFQEARQQLSNDMDYALVEPTYQAWFYDNVPPAGSDAPMPLQKYLIEGSHEDC